MRTVAAFPQVLNEVEGPAPDVDSAALVRAFNVTQQLIQGELNEHSILTPDVSGSNPGGAISKYS